VRVITVDGGRFAHDSVGGETVVIDTLSGELLMITGFGSPLWDAITSGVDIDEVVGQVRSRFGEQPADAVTAFVAALDAAGCLTDLPQRLDECAPPPPGTVLAWPEEFQQPAIERYAEIAGIMHMDPIHEVDPNLGWPRSPGPAES
jgi:hypothetical protein